jgi:single-stranded-DNA-specific exonuclease
VARILAARGWDANDELENYLTPQLKRLRSPFELLEMDRAVERTLRAIRSGEKICVYGDYDVDGVTSTALTIGVLRLLGADPMAVIPHRFNDGYGMNVARVEEIARAGCRLILTVDTGVSAVEPVRKANQLGIDVVVTDHHLAGDELPATTAFVNPNRSDSPYEHTRLCGVGVAFKFAHALLKESGLAEGACKAFLLDQLDLVALGTVADVVPLTGENRVFVRHGLEAISRSRRPGIQALLEVAGLAGKSMTPHGVGFGLGPRLNAAGRTQDATLALELLLATDSIGAERLAKKLDELNRERQEIERAILEASLDAVQQEAGGEGWHLGVVGIVASRLTEIYDRPAIVLGIHDNLAKGSARSIPGFDLHEALTACAKYLETYGGHAGAAGLKLKVSSLPAFTEAINEHAGEVFTTLDRVVPLEIDAEVRAEEIDWPFYADLQRLQPFGEANPQPHLLLRGVHSAAPPRIVGNNHLKLRLRSRGYTFDSIGFNQGHLLPVFQDGEADIVFRAMENTFQGVTRLELELVDGKRAGA